MARYPGDPKDAKDLKTLSAPVHGSEMSLSVGFHRGAADLRRQPGVQYARHCRDAQQRRRTAINPTGVTGLADHTDVWQFVEQIPVQFNVNKSTFIKVAPGFDSYLSGGSSGIPSSFTNGTVGSTSFSGGTLSFYGPNIADHLQIFQAPGEVDWKIGQIPFKVYWDFDLNTDGKARVQDVMLGNGNALGVAGNTGTGAAAASVIQNQNRGMGDNIAWLAGLQIGQNKKKGDWSIRGDFRPGRTWRDRSERERLRLG
ncbi:MAG: hypothetical protein WDO13_12570 [Verrucomicrobiota bacterium]